MSLEAAAPKDIELGGRKTPPFYSGKALIIGNTRPEDFTVKFIMCINYVTRQENDMYLQQLSSAFLKKTKIIGKRINKDLLVSYKTVYNPQELCGSTEKVITVLSSTIKKLTRAPGSFVFLRGRCQSYISDPVGFLQALCKATTILSHCF